MIRQSGTLKLCAMRIRLRGTESTPLNVEITVGKNTLKAIVATFEPSPIPSQRMRSGSSAIFGIGKSAATSGKPTARDTVKSPIMSPAPTPNSVPSTQP